MSTAAGESQAYLVTLDSVQVGSILLRNVQATVSTLANSPDITLLGMSALQRVDMVTEGNRLRLIPRR
jgi:aspartyl protease family protein